MSSSFFLDVLSFAAYSGSQSIPAPLTAVGMAIHAVFMNTLSYCGFRWNVFKCLVNSQALSDITNVLKYIGRDLHVRAFFESDRDARTFENGIYDLIYDLRGYNDIESTMTFTARQRLSNEVYLKKAHYQKLPTYSDGDDRSPTHASSTIGEDPVSVKHQSLTKDSPALKLMRCHLVDHALLRSFKAKRQKVSGETVDDDNNKFWAVGLVHGHLDGPQAGGDLLATLRPVVQDQYQLVSGRYLVYVDLCYTITNGLETVISTLAPYQLISPVGDETLFFTRIFRFAFYVTNPAKFVYCASWKYNKYLDATRNTTLPKLKLVESDAPQIHRILNDEDPDVTDDASD